MIFISAGHHHEKRGACWRGFCEFPESVAWADAICRYLPCGMGYRVPNGYLKHKASYINRLCPDGRGIALEVHFNAALDANNQPVGEGCMTLHYPGSIEGMQAAQAVQDAMLAHFQPDRGIREGYYRLDPARGVNFFLRQVIAPALIIEPEFIYHRERITSRREDCCKDIALALKDTYLSLFP